MSMSPDNARSDDFDPRIEQVNETIAELRDSTGHRGYLLVQCHGYTQGWANVVQDRVIGRMLARFRKNRDPQGMRSVGEYAPHAQRGAPGVRFTLWVCVDGAQYPEDFWEIESPDTTFRKLLVDRRLPYGHETFDLRWVTDAERDRVIDENPWISTILG